MYIYDIYITYDFITDNMLKRHDYIFRNRMCLWDKDLCCFGYIILLVMWSSLHTVLCRRSWCHDPQEFSITCCF